MSQNLADLLSQIKKITTLSDLLLIQQTLTTQMQTVVTPRNDNGNGVHAAPHAAAKLELPAATYGDDEPYVASEEIHPEYIKLPGTYRLSPEFIAETHRQLKAMLPPEEQEDFGKDDVSLYVFDGKSPSQMLIEDREDRF